MSQHRFSVLSSCLSFSSRYGTKSRSILKLPYMLISRKCGMHFKSIEPSFFSNSFKNAIFDKNSIKRKTGDEHHPL